MKRLLLVLVLVLSACAPKAELYEKMQEVEPYTYEIVWREWPLPDKETVWITHELRLNDKETLYYVPRSCNVGDYLYLNSRAFYFIVSETKITECSEETINEILYNTP